MCRANRIGNSPKSTPFLTPRHHVMRSIQGASARKRPAGLNEEPLEKEQSRDHNHPMASKKNVDVDGQTRVKEPRMAFLADDTTGDDEDDEHEQLWRSKNNPTRHTSKQSRSREELQSHYVSGSTAITPVAAISPVPPPFDSRRPDEETRPELKANSPEFRRELNRRMGISDIPDKSEASRTKRDRRLWVLEECIRRGMDLRRNFNSYSYESKMYPAIKSITKSAPAQWGWDRSITKDIIRTLCWDRVRTVNRRAARRSSLAAAKSQQNPVPISTGIAKSTAGRAHIFSSDEDEVQIRPKLPTKTVPRASIPPVASKKYPPTTPTKPRQQNLPITPPVPTSPMTQGIKLHKSQVSPRPCQPITLPPKDKFSVKVRGQIIWFPKNVSYIEFDTRINSYIPVGHDDMRCYRAMAGSNRDREWKPLCYEEELESVIRLYSNVGVELTIKKKVVYFQHIRCFTDVEHQSSYYNSEAEGEESDSNLVCAIICYSYMCYS